MVKLVDQRTLSSYAAVLAVFLWWPLAAQEASPPLRLKVVVLEGEGAINNISQHRAKEPVVQVVDENGMPVRGSSVNFLLPDSGPSATFSGGLKSLAVVADDKGEAVGRGLVPNAVAGRYQIQVTASFRGQTSSAVIDQTNAEAGAASNSRFPKKYLIIGAIAGAAAAGAALAMGGHGSSSPTPTTPASGPLGIVIVSGTPSFQPPH